MVSEDGTRFVSHTSYNPQGQVVAQRLAAELVEAGGGLTKVWEYDPATLRLTALRAGVTGPWRDLQDLSYIYDPAGNIVSLVDGVNAGQRQCFRYDGLNRLTGAFTGNSDCSAYNDEGVGAYHHTYEHNAIGNITGYDGNAYTYGGAQPHAVTSAFGNTYAYDANGNQVIRVIRTASARTASARTASARTASAGSQTHTLGYDAENRLVSVRTQGAPAAVSPLLSHTVYLPIVAGGGEAAPQAVFLYDADGNRVKGGVDGVTVVYIAGVYEWRAGATTTYYDGGAMRRSGHASDNGVFYVLADHLGTTSVIVSQAGEEVARQYHYPFGARRGSGLSGLTTKRFTGQYHEAGVAGGEGLSYYTARWYDPQVGRFVSADTIVPRLSAPQAFNRYSYAGNSPVKFGDSTGHACDDGPQTWAACFGSKPVSRQVWHAADTSYGRGSVRLSTVLRWRQLLTSPNRPRYIQTKHYGVIDIDHFEGARDQAMRIIRSLENGERNFVVSQPLVGEVFGFAARYAPIRTTNAAARISVALGIFYDFSNRFETWQGSGLLGEVDKRRGYSSYAAEDFPSDYLGFISVSQGLPLEYIVGVLGGGEPIDQKPSVAARNYRFTPLVPDNQGVYRNVPWPAELQMTPEHAFRFIDSWPFLFERP